MSTPWIDPAVSVLLTVGVGGCALGLAGLLRSSRARWVPGPLAVGLALAVASFCTAAVVAGQPAGVWLPPALALTVCGVACVLRSGLLARLAVSLRAYAPGRHLQAAALVLLCPLLTWVWVSHLTAQDNLLTDTWAGVERPPRDWTYQEVSPPVAHTDAGRPVKVQRRTGSWTPQSVAPQQAMLLRQWGAQHHVIPIPSKHLWCNCHGWVFTGGRYFLLETELEAILNDNGYRAVEAPATGDLVIYREESGWPIHSGVVRVADPDLPVLVESKWGDLDRFLHPVTTHPYGATRVCYYRSPRGSHILRGLDGSSPSGDRQVVGPRPVDNVSGKEPAPAKANGAE